MTLTTYIELTDLAGNQVAVRATDGRSIHIHCATLRHDKRFPSPHLDAAMARKVVEALTKFAEEPDARRT